MKIAEINLALDAIAVLQRGGPIPTKLAYCLARNRRHLAVAKEIHDEALKGDYDAVLEAWDRDRVVILRAHAVKDALGNPMTDSSGAVKFEPDTDVEAILKELSGKHPDFDEAKAQRDKRMRELAEEEIEVEVYAIPMSMWSETVQASLLDALFYLIIDDDRANVPAPAAPLAPVPHTLAAISPAQQARVNRPGRPGRHTA
jgi:hypothetical protein